MAVREELVEGPDVSAALLISARVVELQVRARGQVLDRQGLAQDAREHSSTDMPGTVRTELPRSFYLKIPISLTDLAPCTQSKRMSLFQSGGTVEGRWRVVSAQIVEVEVHRQEVRRCGCVDTKEQVVRGGRVNIIFANDHGLRP